MPPPKSNKTLDARQKEILKRWVAAGGRVSAALVVRAAGQGTDPRRPERRRRAGPAPARRGRAEALARGRPPHADPPAVFDLTRPAADARGGRGVRRTTRRPTPTSSWSTACWPARTTASGWRSAGSTWCGSPTRSATTATTPRNVWPYRDWVIKSFNDNKPLRPLHARADRRRPAARREHRDPRRLGVQPPAAQHRGRGRAAEGLRGPHADRPRPRRRGGVAGPDDRLRQCHDHKFDPFTDARLLLARRVLRRHPGADHRPPRGRHGRRLGRGPEDRSPGSTPPSPRRRSVSRPWPPSSTSPRQQWEADVSRYGVTLPELARDSKATRGREVGRAGRPGGAQEGREGAQRRRNARRCRPISGRRPRRCSPAERDAVAQRRAASARRSPTALPKCLVSVSSAHQAHRAHPAARQLDGRERRGRQARPAALPAPAEGRPGAN